VKSRVVLDTNQIISAGTRWINPLYPNSSEAIDLVRIVAREHTGLYTGKIMGEYVEKLLDLGHPPERVKELSGLLMGAFEMVRVTNRKCNPAPADRDDEIFLVCALDGNADYLVSNDSDLLDLKDHYNPPVILDRKDALTSLECVMK
jgi:putative PIN family toxin of toxin-antitoxin system